MGFFRGFFRAGKRARHLCCRKKRRGKTNRGKIVRVAARPNARTEWRKNVDTIRPILCSSVLFCLADLSINYCCPASKSPATRLSLIPPSRPSVHEKKRASVRANSPVQKRRRRSVGCDQSAVFLPFSVVFRPRQRTSRPIRGKTVEKPP